jgi:hypothetical protein
MHSILQRRPRFKQQPFEGEVVEVVAEVEAGESSWIQTIRLWRTLMLQHPRAAVVAEVVVALQQPQSRQIQ